MEPDDRWVAVAEFGAAYQADLVEGILRDAGIPVLVKGPEIGIFGPGFAGATSRGVTIFVPASFHEEALELLDDL